MECGHVGCCDDSKNKHATQHFNKTKHPIIYSFEPGETWGWCYVDNIMFETEEQESSDAGKKSSPGTPLSGVE
jgi:hypothetical protein